MSWLDYLLLALVAIVVILAIRGIVLRKKNGGCHNCGGDCPHCRERHSEKNRSEKKR
ncbi:MAG: FeoB-associated Cys-rich membrane protein [Christensenellaceae bacterium]